MKRMISILLMCLMTLTLFACGNTPGEQESDPVTPPAERDITEIEISEASAVYRDSLFAGMRLSEMTEEEIRRVTEQTLASLRTRTGQTFPELNTAHKLKKQTESYGTVYSLSEESNDRAVLFLHGGAWVFGITAEQAAFCDKLVDTLHADVYMPLYPLAPESTYRDTYAMIGQVYDELCAQGKPVLLMGDSAGGSMALGFALDLKEKGKPLPDRIVVLAPCADATFENPEIAEYEKRDGLLPRLQCAECAKLWAGETDLKQPVISPLYGDFTGFPDTMLFCGTYDILCPDAVSMFDRMCDAGVRAKLVKGNGFWHDFPLYGIEEQSMCLDLIRGFCD